VPDAGTALAVFLVAVAASTVGAMVGGGSLLSIPFLIFLGLPPQVAIATDRFAGLGVAATAGYRYGRARKIVWRHVPALSVASLLGSLIGASVLVGAEPGSLDTVIGVLLVVMVPLLFVSREFGVAPRAVSRPRQAIGLLLYFLIQVLAGFFGGGTLILIFYVLIAFFGVTVTQVVATQIVPFVVLTVSSVALFAARGLIDYPLGIVLTAGAAVGGWLGAHLAIAGGDRIVRRLLAVVVLASAAKLLFW
jgi:uncharacterized membrane protein YfcA